MRLAIVALALAMSGCAASSTGGATNSVASNNQGRQCFSVRSVSSFNAVDEDTINIRVGVNDYWQMETFGPCRDVDWAQGIAIRSRGGSSFVCSAMDAEVIAPSNLGPER